MKSVFTFLTMLPAYTYPWGYIQHELDYANWGWKPWTRLYIWRELHHFGGGLTVLAGVSLFLDLFNVNFLWLKLTMFMVMSTLIWLLEYYDI